jgi:hypothetical protein
MPAAATQAPSPPKPSRETLRGPLHDSRAAVAASELRPRAYCRSTLAAFIDCMVPLPWPAVNSPSRQTGLTSCPTRFTWYSTPTSSPRLSQRCAPSSFTGSPNGSTASCATGARTAETGTQLLLAIDTRRTSSHSCDGASGCLKCSVCCACFSVREQQVVVPGDTLVRLLADSRHRWNPDQLVLAPSPTTVTPPGAFHPLWCRSRHARLLRFAPPSAKLNLDLLVHRLPGDLAGFRR